MKKARTLADIRNHPFVESTHTEWDGCFTDALDRERPGRWVYLKPGYICPSMECGTIHEASIRDCCEMLNESRRCTPEEVEQAGYTLADAQASWDEELT